MSNTQPTVRRFNSLENQIEFMRRVREGKNRVSQITYIPTAENAELHADLRLGTVNNDFPPVKPENTYNITHKGFSSGTRFKGGRKIKKINLKVNKVNVKVNKVNVKVKK